MIVEEFKWLYNLEMQSQELRYQMVRQSQRLSLCADSHGIIEREELAYRGPALRCDAMALLLATTYCSLQGIYLAGHKCFQLCPSLRLGGVRISRASYLGLALLRTCLILTISGP